MRPLTAVELLDAWERGLSKPACVRALDLLAAACPDYSSDAVAALEIGERDRWLLTLREWTFGHSLESVIHCSRCNERLEWTLDVSDLRVSKQSGRPADLAINVSGYSASFRLPNSLDLLAIADCTDAATASDVLLKRCVLETRLGGREIASDELPVEVEDAIVEMMAQADPQADIQLDLSCPSCDHQWQALFDIDSFFWNEINAWAQRILGEVHVLARAYGWRETDILNLSPWRRQLYLNLVAG